MHSALHRLGLVAALLFIPLAAIGQGALKKSYTDEELVEILKDDGYRAVEISEERVITIKIDGLTYVLFVYEDDDLQLYFGVTGYAVDADDMVHADHVFQGHSGIEFNAQSDFVSASQFRREVFNLGSLPGNPGPARGNGADAVGESGRVETRADHHREDELVPAIGICECVEILNGQVDLLSRFSKVVPRLL